MEDAQEKRCTWCDFMPSKGYKGNNICPWCSGALKNTSKQESVKPVHQVKGMVFSDRVKFAESCIMTAITNAVRRKDRSVVVNLSHLKCEDEIQEIVQVFLDNKYDVIVRDSEWITIAWE